MIKTCPTIKQIGKIIIIRNILMMAAVVKDKAKIGDDEEGN